jgi:opine dehydrogenase
LAEVDPGTVVTIVGAGVGGSLLAVLVAPTGCKVRLHDIDDSQLTDFRIAKGIEVAGPGGGFFPLDLVTADLSAAASGTDIFMVCTGGQHQERVAQSIAPLLRDGQLILLVQGNTGGALVFRRTLDRAGCSASVDIAEMDSFPNAARRLGPASFVPITVKQGLQIAAFPGNRGDAVHARLAPFFPTAVNAPNIAHTGFINANAMLHVAGCVCNAGLIDRGVPFKFYADGVTPMVANLYQAIDGERVAVAAGLGVKVPDLAQWWQATYGVREGTLSETARELTFGRDGPYQNAPTPSNFQDNYVAEDVPCGLVPIAEIGRAVGVPTPAIDALIRLAGILAADDFAASARTLERMGLAGKTAAEIVRILDEGF